MCSCSYIIGTNTRFQNKNILKKLGHGSKQTTFPFFIVLTPHTNWKFGYNLCKGFFFVHLIKDIITKYYLQL